MVTLDYSFDAEELKRLDSFDFTKLTVTDLDYYLFCGRIAFRANEARLDADWDWIPIFNFCVRLNLMLSELAHQAHAVLEFTENEAMIEFEMKNSLVTISAEYAGVTASVPQKELAAAVHTFSRKLIVDLAARWPTAVRTTAFQERLRLIQLPKQ